MQDFYDIHPTIKEPGFGLRGLENNLPELIESQNKINRHLRRTRRLIVAALIVNLISVALQIINICL